MPVRYVLSSVWIRLSICSPFIQYMGAMCFQFINFPCDDWENIHFVLISSNRNYGQINCLGISHEIMVSAVYSYDFVPTKKPLFIICYEYLSLSFFYASVRQSALGDVTHVFCSIIKFFSHLSKICWILYIHEINCYMKQPCSTVMYYGTLECVQTCVGQVWVQCLPLGASRIGLKLDKAIYSTVKQITI